MSEEEYESPYCEVCGTCGYIGCCGIRNFISEHIEGKTNCKNEDLIISELIDLCEYKDKVFVKNKEQTKEIERLNNIIDELEKKMGINFVIKNEDSSGKQIIDTKQTEGAILFRDYLKQELKKLKQEN